MDNHTATEIAYKNGYEQGKKDAVDEALKDAGMIVYINKCYEKSYLWRNMYRLWIKAEDGLPDNMEEVLVYTGQIMGVGYNDYKFGWTWRDEDGEIIENVTHWMPLPEPPKEEEGETE